MGYWASPDKDQGKLYLKTNYATKRPYSKPSYRLSMVSNSFASMTQAKGLFKISFVFANGTSSDAITIDNDQTIFTKASTNYFLLGLTGKQIRIDDIKSASLSFSKTILAINSVFFDGKWSFKSIYLFSGQDQKGIKLCPDSDFLNSGAQVRLTASGC